MTSSPLRLTPALPPFGLDGTTPEQRRNMPRAELVRRMGSLHVMHKDFKPRPYVPVHVPNQVHRKDLELPDQDSFWHLCRQFLRFALR